MREQERLHLGTGMNILTTTLELMAANMNRKKFMYNIFHHISETWGQSLCISVFATSWFAPVSFIFMSSSPKGSWRQLMFFFLDINLDTQTYPIPFCHKLPKTEWWKYIHYWVLMELPCRQLGASVKFRRLELRLVFIYSTIFFPNTFNLTSLHISVKQREVHCLCDNWPGDSAAN